MRANMDIEAALGAPTQLAFIENYRKLQKIQHCLRRSTQIIPVFILCALTHDPLTP